MHFPVGNRNVSKSRIANKSMQGRKINISYRNISVLVQSTFGMLVALTVCGEPWHESVDPASRGGGEKSPLGSSGV